MQKTCHCIADKNVQAKCCGCSSCMQVCPQKAISMQSSDDGFLYPIVDMNKCNKCGLCLKRCPVSEQGFNASKNEPECYAAFSDKETALTSSSGGLFSTLAKAILSENGVVCGAVMTNDGSVVHTIISDIQDLEALKGSKYVQSDIRNIYTQLKKLLEKNISVLFSGTPCQVAGLYSFLGKDYSNLITLDLFCHGTPSPMIWKRYLTELTGNNPITTISFRDKGSTKKEQRKKGWKNFHFSILNKDHSTLISEPHSKNIYMRGFLGNLYLRKSCSICPFAKTPRAADISLGDFWQYQKMNRFRNLRLGMSALLVNSDKGKTLFNKIKNKLTFLKSVSLKSIIRGNPVLVHPLSAHPNRDFFFKGLKNQKEIIPWIKNCCKSREVGILNFSFSSYNYGALLVGYAMEQICQKLGYRPSTINFVPQKALVAYSAPSPFSEFRKHFLNLTEICTTKTELVNRINSRFETIIIGSDQIVRHPWHENFVYYLDWVYGKKNLIAYAASFGREKLNMPFFKRLYAKKCIRRFDSFSVRENSGKHIMEKSFNHTTTQVVCDPTLLLTAEDYQPIIDNELLPQKDKEYIAYYFLKNDEKLLQPLKKKYEIINVYKNEQNEFRTFGEWLNLIKNAKFVITDSFHGTVFSLLYHKQFVTLTTPKQGNERLITLMDKLGLSHFINSTEFNESWLCNHTIDYQKIEPKLNLLKKEGLSFLEQALQKELLYKKPITHYRKKV